MLTTIIYLCFFFVKAGIVTAIIDVNVKEILTINKFVNIITDRFFFYSKSQKNLFIMRNSTSLGSSLPVTFSQLISPVILLYTLLLKISQVEEEYTFFVFAPIIILSSVVAGMRVRITCSSNRPREVEKVRYQLESSKSRGGRVLSLPSTRRAFLTSLFLPRTVYRGTGRRVRVYV